MTDKHKLYIFWGLMGLGLGLRLFQLGVAPFWYDEVFTLNLARLDLFRLIGATAGDFHPPLYYLLNWFLYHATGSTQEWVYRLPSVLFDLITAYYLSRIGYHLKLPFPAILAGFTFFIISPFQIHYSQETRQYSLLQMVLVLTVWFTLERDYIKAGILSGVALYTHNYALFFIPVIALVGLREEWNRPVKISPGVTYDLGWVPGDETRIVKALRCYGLALMAYIPWGFVLATQMLNVKGGYWIEPVTPGSLVYVLYMLFWGFAQSEVLQPLGVMVTAGVLFYSVYYVLRIKQYRVLLWLGFIPLILVTLVSVVVSPIMLFRGLIGSSPFIYLLVGVALFRGSQGWRYLYSAMIFTPLIISGVVCYYLYNPLNKGDLGLLSQVNQIATQGDIIYHVNDGTLLPALWYSHNVNVELPECETRNKSALGYLTRDNLGVVTTPIVDNPHGKNIIVWSLGPLSPQCEVDMMGKILGNTQPVIVVRNDMFVFSGVWIK